MNLLKELLNNAKKPELGFGIHENCVIVSVSNDERKTKTGEVLPRNCYTNFQQLDENNEVVAEKEINWIDLDFSKDYVFDQFIQQVSQLTEIIDCFFPASEEKDVWGETLTEIFTASGVDSEETNPENLKIEIKNILEKDLTLFKTIYESITNTYVDIITDSIEAISKIPVRLKLTFDPKGKNVQQPKYDNFIEPMSVKESKIEMSAKDLEYKNKSLESLKKPLITSKL